MSQTHYQVLRAGSRPQTELEIKRSRFLGYAARVETEEQAREFLTGLRQAHREARHVCHAFVLGPRRDVQRSSDDGEPSGTAGAPILKAIISRQTGPGLSELSDVAVAVVRYFGGVKLGAGGLVQAYSDTAAGTLDAARFVGRQRVRELGVDVPINEIGRLETTLRSQGVRVLPTEYLGNHARLTIAVPDLPAELAAAEQRLATLSAGRASLIPGATSWIDETMNP